MASLIPSFTLNQPDKFMHFVAGAAIGVLPPPFGIPLATVAGLCKEYYDIFAEGHTSSWNDVIMTVIGAIFTTTIIYDLRKIRS